MRRIFKHGEIQNTSLAPELS